MSKSISAKSISRKSVSAGLVVPLSACVMTLLALAPAQAKSEKMPEGERDKKAMEQTMRQEQMQKKENREADSNVDGLIKNRK
jgi:hypothetical protein